MTAVADTPTITTITDADLSALIERTRFRVPRTWPESHPTLIWYGKRDEAPAFVNDDAVLADHVVFIPREQAERVFAQIRSARSRKGAATRKAEAETPAGERASEAIQLELAKTQDQHARETAQLQASFVARVDALLAELGAAVKAGR